MPATLNDFIYVNGATRVKAEHVNRLIAAALRSEYKNVESLSATKTLTDGDTPIQRLNCNGANRIAKLPTANATENHPFLLVNSTSTGNYTLTTQNNGGTVTYAVLMPGEYIYFVPDGNGGYVPFGRTFWNVLTPAQITSSQNDYFPAGAGSADVIRISTDASRNITGLAFIPPGKPVLLLNVGTQNAVLKDESASSVAANRFALSADVTLTPDMGVLAWYDTTSSRVRIIGGGGGGGGSSGPIAPTITSLTLTTADVTATVVTGGVSIHKVDISGLTANHNFNLPTGTVGDRIKLILGSGDDTYALIIKGAATVTINGGSAATEWSRVRTTNEIVELVLTTTTNWQVELDGRIPCAGAMSDINAQNIANSTYTKVTFDTANANVGNMVDLTNDKLVIWRSGVYKISAQVYFYNFAAGGLQCVTYKNGSPTGMQQSEDSTLGMGTSSYGNPKLYSYVTLAAGDYVELYGRQNSGSAQNPGMKPGAPCFLTLEEVLS